MATACSCAGACWRVCPGGSLGDGLGGGQSGRVGLGKGLLSAGTGSFGSILRYGSGWFGWVCSGKVPGYTGGNGDGDCSCCISGKDGTRRAAQAGCRAGQHGRSDPEWLQMGATLPRPVRARAGLSLLPAGGLGSALLSAVL